MAEQHSFIFPIASIKELIEQRTSVLGKMRSGEDNPHLLDRLSLTEGESFLTNEWLEEAAAETYDWIKAFGRNVSEAFRIFPNGELRTIKNNDGVHIEVDGKKNGLRWAKETQNGDYEIAGPIMTLQGELPARGGASVDFGKFSLDSGIVLNDYTANYRFLLTTNRSVEVTVDGHWHRTLAPDEQGEDSAWWDNSFRLNPGEVFILPQSFKDFINPDAEFLSEISFQVDSISDADNVTQLCIEVYAPQDAVSIPFPSVNIDKGDAQSIDYDIIIHHTDGVRNSPISDKRTHIEHCHATSNVQLPLTYTTHISVQQVPELGMYISLLSIDKVEVVISHIERAPSQLSKGDYVQVIDENGSVRYGIMCADYDSMLSNDVLLFNETESDIRNSIVMKVELPDWQDRNMLPAIERNLKEALANYIIYRWFEIVNPKEADAYYVKFEEKAHQAQLGLNTEKRTLQRKSTWL